MKSRAWPAAQLSVLELVKAMWLPSCMIFTPSCCTGVPENSRPPCAVVDVQEQRDKIKYQKQDSLVSHLRVVSALVPRHGGFHTGFHSFIEITVPGIKVFVVTHLTDQVGGRNSFVKETLRW